VSKVNLLFVLTAVAAMLLGLHLALIRLGYVLPGMGLAPYHGPVMVVGFLGSLIALERAVALRRGWVYAAPPLLLLGGLMAMFNPTAMLLGAVGALVVVGVFAHLTLKYGHRPQWVVMGLGALMLAAGNLLYALKYPITYVQSYWILFLVFTIAGERLELSILLIPRRGVVSTFYVPVLMATLGAVVGSGPILGISYILFALWLSYYDVAGRNVRGSGLVRFVALNLLLGYVWLFLGGVGWLLGWGYDFRIHSITLGFVFGMIFAHAPIIFPAILGFQFKFRPYLYASTFLLHLSLVVRFLLDKKVGGLLGVIAVLLYFVSMRTLINFRR